MNTQKPQSKNKATEPDQRDDLALDPDPELWASLRASLGGQR